MTWEKLPPKLEGAESGGGMCKVSTIGSGADDTGFLTVDASSLAGSSKKFEKLVRAANKPVLIRGTSQAFDLHQLCAVQNAQRIEVNSRKSYKHSDWKVGRWNRQKLHWSGVCKRLFMGAGGSGTQSTESLRKLLNRFDAPYMRMPAKPFRKFWGSLPLYRGQRNAQSAVWIGNDASQTALHIDAFDNIAMQLSGTKRWRIFSPKHHKELTYGGFQELWNLERQTCERKRFTDSSFSSYTLLNGTSPPSDVDFMEVEVQAGDSLYLPHYWGHFVENHGVNIMTNFWLRESWSCCGDQSHWTPPVKLLSSLPGVDTE